MTKNIFTVIVGVLLLITAGRANADMIIGSQADAIDFCLSVLLCVYLIALPFIYKNNKDLTITSLWFYAVILIDLVVMLLAANKIIVIPHNYIAIALTVITIPFYGLTYFIDYNPANIILIAVVIVGSAISISNLHKKKFNC